MRKRGYIIFTAVVAIAVMLLFLLPKHQPRPVVTETAAAADSLLPEKSHHSSQRMARSYSYARAHDSYLSRERQAAADESQACHAASGVPSHTSSRRTRVSLNSADTLDWQQLYNVGPAFARRIVKYRNLLGGFVHKEQLLEVYGMDSARYACIAPYIDIDSAGVEQMDINSATIDQLKHHPYLDYYQAKAIVGLREKEGAYHSVSDLRKVPVIDQETYNKILPYITCNSQPNR